MRPSRVLFSLAFLASGCTVAWDVARTTIVEPAHYPTNLEHCRIQADARNAAEKAWQEIDGGQTYCKDYQLGFKEGFADYLQYGGNGEPPSIPPRRYWKKDSIAGRQEGMEWSAGFRTGAAAAKRTGLRDLIVVPLTGPGISSSHSDQDVIHEPRHETPPVLPIPRPFEPNFRPM